MNNHENSTENTHNEKPALLKAIEIVLAKPEDIKKETETLYQTYQNKYKETKDDNELKRKVAKKNHF